jgi:hypothetical protein
VRSNLVVLTPELLDRDLRIDPVSEPLYRETFVSELFVERFASTVLPRLSRINVRGIDVGLRQPLQDRERVLIDWT